MNDSVPTAATRGGPASWLRAGALAAAAVLSACGGAGGAGVGASLAALPAIAPAPPPAPPAPTADVTCKDLDGKDVTVRAKTITVHNNSGKTIYPVLSTSENATNEWIQGCFRVADKQYPTRSVYKLYVNEGSGIPANSSVTVTLPLYSELSSETFITWWNGGRVVLADSHERLRGEEDVKLDTPAAVTCQGQNTRCQLSVYSSAVQFPENVYAQLSEYTFGDSVIPAGQTTRLLKPENVGYNISYVDHVYLPVGIGPRNNPYIGYSGSVQSLPEFAGALRAFITSGPGVGWPVYNMNALKLPGGYNVFAQRGGFVPATDNVPVKPSSGNPPVLTVQECVEGGCTDAQKRDRQHGLAVERMQNMWGSCVGWGAEDLSPYVTQAVVCPSDLSARLDAVRAFFEKNHQDYLALYAGGQCQGSTPQKPGFTFMEAIKHIYGWVPFNEGCGAAANPLADTAIPGWTHATIQPMYIHDLQYGYQQVPAPAAAFNFNPYVKLIHDDLKMNAYGFSVDDAVGFMSELGDGLVFVVGGPAGLENGRQFGYADGFAVAIGDPTSVGEGTPLIRKYGVCALNQEAGDAGCAADKQDVNMPANRKILGFRVGTVPGYPVKVRFTDQQDNLYTFQVAEKFQACSPGVPGASCAPANAAAIRAGLSCSVLRPDGTVHPKSAQWCTGADPNQNKEKQVTKNFMSFPMPVGFL